MNNMYYYAETHSDGSVTYCETNVKRTDENFEQITSDEYISACERMFAEAESKLQAEAEAQAEAEQTYIEQLEAENAALLFQVLTGEEYSNV